MNSSSRNGAKVIWLCLHTTEGIMRATDLRAWTSWPGSSHAACDETGALLTPAEGFVPYDRSSWTLRNGNAISENIEQCGFARWTRAEWLSRPKLLDATARWLADRSKARGIPLRRLSHAEVRARVPGVLMHDDYSKATGDGTHWDCGPNYPWDVVLDKARAYAGGGTPPVTPDPIPLPVGEDTMWLAATPDKSVWKITDYDVTPESSLYRMGALSKARGGLPVVQITVEELRDNQADAAARRGALLTDIAKAAGGDVDEAAIIAGLLPKLSAGIAAAIPAGALTRDDVLSAVRQVFGDAATT